MLPIITALAKGNWFFDDLYAYFSSSRMLNRVQIGARGQTLITSIQ